VNEVTSGSMNYKVRPDICSTMPTVYITAPTDAANAIARTLVDEELAACVNLIEISSVYRWDGEVIEDDEIALLAKTTASRYEALKERVVELHPYDVPCIERFDEADVLDTYGQWVDEETGTTE